MAIPILINVPITRYSVFISCLSFLLKRIIPFAATNKPIAENWLNKTKIKMITRTIIPIHLPALARLAAFSI